MFIAILANFIIRVREMYVSTLIPPCPGFTNTAIDYRKRVDREAGPGHHHHNGTSH
jgi:hypothetical protein